MLKDSIVAGIQNYLMIVQKTTTHGKKEDWGDVRLWKLVRDVELKNKSPVSWSVILQARSRLSAIYFFAGPEKKRPAKVVNNAAEV